MFVLGPTLVGVPLLVQENFSGNSVIFGSLKTAHGAGALVGSILAVALAKRIFAHLGALVLSADIIIGVLFFFFANTSNVPLAHVSIFTVGVLGGVVQVGVFTWVQGNTDSEYMGRVMSYLMFASIGLVPISAFLSGYVVGWYSARILFEGMGCLMAIIALTVLALSTRVRNLQYKVTG